jgi:hypothetical protein
MLEIYSENKSNKNTAYVAPLHPCYQHTNLYSIIWHMKDISISTSLIT